MLFLGLHFVLVSLETWDRFEVYTDQYQCTQDMVTQEVPAVVNSKRQLMQDHHYSEHMDFIIYKDMSSVAITVKQLVHVMFQD